MALSPFGRSTSIFDPFDTFDLWDSSPEQVFALQARAMAGTKVDWIETEDAHVFKAELPGLKKEEIKVQLVDGRTLEISGKRTKQDEKRGNKFHRVERSHGEFMRRVGLPENANVDEVNAKSENGVLTVTVPNISKQEPQTRIRRKGQCYEVKVYLDTDPRKRRNPSNSFDCGSAEVYKKSFRKLR